MKLTLDQVTGKQIMLMKHALGTTGGKKSYRNYFNCSPNDKDWSDLVDKGFAVMRKGWSDDDAYFHVTDEAIELLKLT